MMELDCRKISEELKLKLSHKVKSFYKTLNLGILLVGTDASSRVYVNRKRKLCEDVGIGVRIIEFPDSNFEDELLLGIKTLVKYDGILVQLPLPICFNRNKIIESIPYEKDVDCFHPINLGRLALGDERFLPPTVSSILHILDYCKINVKSKHCVIINDTIVVGRPLSQVLLNRQATVSLCNSYTVDLSAICQSADIIITAVGKRPKFVLTAEYCKKDVIIIDVGINRLEKLVGDVDMDSVQNLASLVTRVPGGVGALTPVFLLENVIKLSEIFSTPEYKKIFSS